MSIMRIKERREAAGLSQVELGTQMGVVQGAIANWEAEVSLPKARDLPHLAAVLGCTIDDLFSADQAREKGGNGIAAADMPLMDSSEPDSDQRGPAVSSFDPDPET